MLLSNTPTRLRMNMCSSLRRSPRLTMGVPVPHLLPFVVLLGPTLSSWCLPRPSSLSCPIPVSHRFVHTFLRIMPSRRQLLPLKGLFHKFPLHRLVLDRPHGPLTPLVLCPQMMRKSVGQCFLGGLLPRRPLLALHPHVNSLLYQSQHLSTLYVLHPNRMS